MQSAKRMHAKRLRNIVTIFSLSAILLSVATYAWFIGLQTVTVSSFDVEIQSTESLLLSLDGSKWDYSVSINKNNHKTISYAGNKNSWGGAEGMSPVSSVGVVNATSSRLTMYEKGSLTTTPGGYRILASEIPNTDPAKEEADGYVAFDLFIKNLSGTAYYEPFDYTSFDDYGSEEAIYLTTDSLVDRGTDGVAGTGIENSVRVAFTQIGRVAATTTTAATITGIDCTGSADVTGTCAKTAQIWEPNDVKHVTNAINWYNKTCAERTAISTYGAKGSCTTFTETDYVPTYAISKEITPGNIVDVYDGTSLNKYTATVGAGNFLYEFPYFTDTEKDLEGTDRPAFMYLAPNSITKVRVYVYIEGQDIDNYDFASIGKSISVKFGFTKERFTEDEAGFPTLDVQEPVVVLNGAETMNLVVGDTYTEPGATAYDNVDGALVPVVTGTVDTATAGTYVITYTATDAAGNSQAITRNVIVAAE